MHEPALPTLEDAALATVVGGAGADVNTDEYSSKLKFPKALGRRIPIPGTTTTKTRTEFGQCADDGTAACERKGGGNTAVGDCSLDAIQTCWDAKERKGRSSEPGE